VHIANIANMDDDLMDENDKSISKKGLKTALCAAEPSIAGTSYAVRVERIQNTTSGREGMTKATKWRKKPDR
jgi:hypothetical protein